MNFESILFKSKQLTSQITGVYELSLSGFSHSDLTEMIGVTLNLCSSLHNDIQSNNTTTENTQAELKMPTKGKNQTSFAARLRLALAHSGMTQGVLADWTGISQSTISSYVTGKVKEAGFVRSAGMARALGVNAKWLIYGEGEMLSAKNLTKDSEV